MQGRNRPDMNINIRQNPTQKPPFWETSSQKGVLVAITCPNGHSTPLVSDFHRVGPTGLLLPAYQCPKCPFFEYLVLSGFPPQKHS